ncbi:hypothetical protein NP493_1006g00035 [Ridgeia piscesae]|uniref:SAM dependent carboxyl methyltransferase n=1 Tax=Ridgeia piscesae TaxID=27915 RepID=A0AAD9KIY0_RIDPI|nr:hypothetical protein NP493_1006g00035 [Ridgeia piscesae]
MTKNENDDVKWKHSLYTGDGRFGDLSNSKQEVEDFAWPVVKGLLSSIPFTTGHGPFVICDYGAADGISSISLMKNCIDWVQKTYGENQQVHIIYEDLPNNDFNSLIGVVEGWRYDVPGSLLDQKNVFVTCCGRTFYKQCLPDASVHLGISLLALMWSSVCPDVTSSEVFSVHFVKGSPEHRVFEVQSARDWETFLLHRAKELVPGGRLAIQTVGRETCPCTGPGSDVWCMTRSMSDIWSDMMNEEYITEAEYLATIEPYYYHTEEALCAAFKDTSSPIRQSGLRLLAIETHNIKCLWRDRWMRSIKQDDAAAKKHALSFVQWIRTWSNRTFTTGLSSDRNSEEKENILDEMFSRLVDQVAIAPADRGYSRVDHFVSVAKIGEV